MWIKNKGLYKAIFKSAGISEDFFHMILYQDKYGVLANYAKKKRIDKQDNERGTPVVNTYHREDVLEWLETQTESQWLTVKKYNKLKEKILND